MARVSLDIRYPQEFYTRTPYTEPGESQWESRLERFLPIYVEYDTKSRILYGHSRQFERHERYEIEYPFDPISLKGFIMSVLVGERPLKRWEDFDPVLVDVVKDSEIRQTCVYDLACWDENRFIYNPYRDEKVLTPHPLYSNAAIWDAAQWDAAEGMAPIIANWINAQVEIINKYGAEAYKLRKFRKGHRPYKFGSIPVKRHIRRKMPVRVGTR